MKNAIPNFLRYQCNTNAELPLLTFDSNEYLTYGTFLQNIEKTKQLLETYGVGNGKRFCIALDNTPEFLFLVFGGLFCGGTAVNLNPNLSEAEFEFRLKDSAVSAFFSTLDIIEKLSAILFKLGIKAYIVPTGFNSDINNYTLNDLVSYKSPKDENENDIPSIPLYENNIAFLQYTGGTTGTTKAAVITHENVIASVHQMSQYLSPRLENSKETFIVTFPFFHVFAITFQVLTAIQFAGKIVLNPKVRDFERLEMILAQENFTVFVGVQTLYKYILDSKILATKTFPKARLFIAGAEHIQPQTKARWLKRTGHHIIEGYGLTETTALVCMSLLDAKNNDFDSIGEALPDTQLKLLDEKNNIITSPNTPGELCIKGAQVVNSYWNRPMENEHSFDGNWLKTGDIAIQKPNGQFKIVDRKKDMIITSGNNIYSIEVERTILEYPNILECAVVGKPDQRSGERVVAFYTSAVIINEQNLKSFCEKQLIAYKVPVFFIRIEHMPKTPIGKTQKTLLRLMAKDLI